MAADAASIPSIVAAALERAERIGFELSSEPPVGRLLAALAVAVPLGGRILELGTGVGHGLAWIVHGLGERDDVEVVSVEIDPAVAELVLGAALPPYVSIEVGDGAERVGRLGSFDLIFADAPGGKLSKLDQTVAALRPGGVLVVDDMDLDRHQDPELRDALASVGHRLLAHPDLACAELAFASGVILAARRRP